jgi:hypothetical protein
VGLLGPGQALRQPNGPAAARLTTFCNTALGTSGPQVRTHSAREDVTPPARKKALLHRKFSDFGLSLRQKTSFWFWHTALHWVGLFVGAIVVGATELVTTATRGR